MKGLFKCQDNKDLKLAFKRAGLRAVAIQKMASGKTDLGILKALKKLESVK